MKRMVSFSDPIVLNGNCLFVSDAHFRTPPDEASGERELRLVHLLKNQGAELRHLFLLGDIFDFWFEYRDVVPRGYVTLFAFLKELQRRGVEIHYFTGNHDMWVEDYFTNTFGAKIYREPQLMLINGRRCLVGHGDGLGGKQRKYLFIKKVFNNPFNQLLYSMLHPRHAFAIARYCSQTSRESHDENVLRFQGEDEHQVMYARDLIARTSIDFFIFAHRHIPVRYELTPSCIFFNTGDWLENFSYVIFDEGEKEPRLCTETKLNHLEEV